jgi:AcrR family transcriptional regulator
MSSRPDVQAMHRRRRSRTRRRILDAALALLEERPWSEISLEQIMARADLSRTAFYRHFDDRQLLLLALLEDVGVRLEDVPARWQDGVGDPETELRAALLELATVYMRHGRLLAAIADVSADDADVRAVYRGLVERLSAAVARRLASDPRRPVEDPEEVAYALIWMNEAYLKSRFGRTPLGDPQRAAAALAEVWIATTRGA